MSTSDFDANYLEFLRHRWPFRTRMLAYYALVGTAVFVALDWVYTRRHGSPPGLSFILALRAPWVAVPAIGLLAQRIAPAWRLLPTLVMMISVAWAWGNDAAFHALGLSGSALQALVVVLCIVTSANFMPLTFRGRAAIVALMALGHTLIDLLWPTGRPLSARLWDDALILVFAVCVTWIFEGFAASQRRGLRLRHELEQTVGELREARRRAEEAVADVGRLAAAVAHEVNNPLSAVKVNVRWLGAHGLGSGGDGERSEVVDDALAAVERISGIVGELRREALERSAMLGPAQTRGARATGREPLLSAAERLGDEAAIGRS